MGEYSKTTYLFLHKLPRCVIIHLYEITRKAMRLWLKDQNSLSLGIASEDIDGLMQKGRQSISIALVLRLACIKPSIYVRGSLRSVMVRH